METPFSVHVTEQLAAKSKRVISQPPNHQISRRRVTPSPERMATRKGAELVANPQYVEFYQRDYRSQGL